MAFKAERKRKPIRPWLEPPMPKRLYGATLKGMIVTNKRGESGWLKILLTESEIPRDLLKFNKGRRVLVKLYLPNGETRAIFCTLNQAPDLSWRLIVPMTQIDATLYQLLKEKQLIKAEIELAEPPPSPST